ncbi:MAG: hypothetical protein AAGI01_12540 [Myxococcota bacterium]
MKSQTFHERLGLRQGCGKRAARDAFIELTHKFHPDAFAGAEYSDTERGLAQEIFLLVQEAREHVLRMETSDDPKNPAFGRLAARAQNRLQGTSAGSAQQNMDALSRADAAYNSISETPRDVSRDADRASLLKGLKSHAARRSLEHTSSILNAESSSASHHSGVGAQQSQQLTDEERRAKFDTLKKRRRPTRSLRESLNGLSRTSSGASLSEPSAPSAPSVLPTRGLKPSKPLYSKGPVENLTPQQSFNIGYRDFTVGRYPEALEPLRRAVEAEPRNGLFLTVYGYVLFLNEPVEKSRVAEQMLHRAIDTENRQALPDAHLYLGKVLKRRGPEYYKKALFHFQQSLELNPHSADAKREVEELKPLLEPKRKAGPMGIIHKMFKRD